MSGEDLKKAEQQLQLERLRFESEKLEFQKKKVGRMTIALSIVALFVSVLQVWVALEQRKLAEAQTFERYIPHLLNTDSKELALTTMSPFVDKAIVANLAEMLKSTETLEDLSKEVDSKDGAEARLAKDAEARLAQLDQQRTALIQNMFSSDKQERIAATTALVRRWSADPRVVSSVLEYAPDHLSHKSGIINSLVVLREFSSQTLRASSEDLVPFLEAAQVNGPQTADLVEDIDQKLSERP